MKKYIFMLILLLCTSIGAIAQNVIEITGTVTDSDGEPLIGANVVVKNVTGLGVITDVNGNFSIKAKENSTLVVSFIGFANQEILVSASQTNVKVTMEEDAFNALDEIVVTGMGTQKKLTVTGAITNVKIDDLKRISSSNLTNALAGNTAGVIAMQTSGQPGKNTSEFWIRGISTFGAGKGAYVLVDGFERNINDLNIEDIESFSVLKDASATAIYGSKGANGVILITTKHGKDGKIQIDGKFEASYNTRTITPDFVDGVTYAQLLNEALVTRNQSALFSDTELELFRTGLDPDIYPNVDWKDKILKRGAWSYRGNINISGGGSTSRYYASVSYTEDQGMYKTDKTLRDKYDTNANYKRWNYRLNVDIDITSTTVLKLGVSGDLSKRNSPGMGDAYAWSSLFGYNNILTPIEYSNGYYPSTNIMRDEHRANPWIQTTQTGYREDWNNNLQSSITLEQDLKMITKGLKFTGRFGYDTYNSSWILHERIPELYYDKGRNQKTGEIAFSKWHDLTPMAQSSGSDGSRREFVDLLLHWDRSFLEAHNVAFNGKYTYDENIQTQNLGDDIKNSVSKKNMATAGQVTYNYKQRYFGDFNFGYNGSENFADGHRFGFFPAFSVAWNVAEELFIKENARINWIDMFKIRYSHGKVGNDYSPSRFPYLYNIGDTASPYEFGSSAASYAPVGQHYSALASEEVTWEVARKDDVGLDFVFFNNRFSVTADYFYEKRTGIFMERRFLPQITGLEQSPWANVGSVRSEGFDGNFKYEDHIGEVGYTVRGNITYSKNKILDYDVEDSPYPYTYQTGYRIDQVRGLIAEGLFKDYEEIRNRPKQMFGDVMPGDIKYKDVNGDGIVDNNDIVAIGATSRPNLMFGWGFSVNWKGIDFNMLFQGAGKSNFMLDGMCVWPFSYDRYGNIFEGMLDNRYVDAATAEKLGIPANEDVNADFPRLQFVQGDNHWPNNYRASTFWMRDGRYIRIKNVDLGYTLPKQWVNRAHINNIRVYVQGSNLYTWSRFDLWDPEMGSSNGEAYPITKAFTFGMQINL